MKLIEYFKSPNFNKRKNKKKIEYIIFHYTAMHDHMEAIKHLCSLKNKVSSHFLVSKKGDIYYLVSTSKRAWHAGQSYWKGSSDINSSSIGIELDNSGHYNDFESFPKNQMNSLIKLVRKISKQYNISHHNILSHSDVAPFRKLDPGEKFHWALLNNKKLSYLPKISAYEKFYIKKNLSNEISIKSLKILKKIGYDTRNVKISSRKFKTLIKCYQMHFLQSNVTGIIDSRTYKTLNKHYKDLLTD